jgi:hypothetical protein
MRKRPQFGQSAALWWDSFDETAEFNDGMAEFNDGMAEFNDGLAEYVGTAECVGAAEYAGGAAELKKIPEVPVHDEREIFGENIPSENCEAGVWRRLFIVFFQLEVF